MHLYYQKLRPKQIWKFDLEKKYINFNFCLITKWAFNMDLSFRIGDYTSFILIKFPNGYNIIKIFTNHCSSSALN